MVEPGVTNLAVSRAVAPTHFYPPDPSSQIVCSIGGNVAENSGGAHCFKYGFTTNYVIGLEVVLSDGDDGARSTATPPAMTCSARSSAPRARSASPPRSSLRVIPAPESVSTMLAFFEDTGAAGDAVTAIVDAGIVPGAIEMMDRLSIQAAEQATGAGYRLDAGAALSSSSTARARSAWRASSALTELCSEAGSLDVRIAQIDAERDLIWRTRKAAFAAMGRIAPAYYVQDGVIPRTRLAEVLRQIDGLATRVRPACGQRLPRWRRQPAPAGLLRLGVEGEAGARRGAGRADHQGLRRCRRLDHRRARRRRRQEGLHALDVLRARPGRVPAPALCL